MNSMLLITGASGFVGRGLLKEALERDIDVRPVYRSLARILTEKPSESPEPVSPLHGVCLPTIDANTDWEEALRGVNVVVHCAARVHVMRDEHNTPEAALQAYRVTNVDGTLNLARQAVAAGVQRFVFLSSVKVNGEFTQPGTPFTANDLPAPQDAYGISKAEAEAGLLQIARETGMEVVIIRPPLVYGPGVKGNFISLLNAVQRGIPLPLGAVKHNLRSMVALGNLVDFILRCTVHPNAANQVFLVSDDEDLSTASLLHKLACALNCPARLLPIPVGFMRFGAALLGKGDVAQRVFGSLQLDIQKSKTLLEWKPVFSVDEALQQLALATPGQQLATQKSTQI